MKHQWDEAKRRSNILEHGFDFADVDCLSAGPTLQAPARSANGEQRWLATGLIDDIAAAVVFTRRGYAEYEKSFSR